MTKRKFIALGLVLLMIFTLFTGCSAIKYNAELFDYANDWIKEDFINDNPINCFANNEYPTERVFIVNSQEEYNKIFNENSNELKVDFATQTLVVYTFGSIYRRNCDLVSLTIADDVLTITYKTENKSGVGDATKPYGRWFVVKLDKIQVDTVVFVEK